MLDDYYRDGRRDLAGDERPRRKRRRAVICLECGTVMTWTERKAQFGRLARSGVHPETISSVLPRCGMCVTGIFETLGLEEVKKRRRSRSRPDA